MNLPNVDASCAICGAPPEPECPHEGQRLKVALDQAQARWDGVDEIRVWVLNHARVQIIHTFQQMKQARIAAHYAYLERLPCYTVFKAWNGNPPLHAHQLMALRTQISQADEIYRQGIDEDWRRSCMRYPEVLDYYFSLVQFSLPEANDPLLRNPRFGGQRKAVKARRNSSDHGSDGGRRRRR